MSMDFVEDAADALANHPSGYLLIAVHIDNESALCFSGNVKNREQLEWLREKANTYLDGLAERLPSPE